MRIGVVTFPGSLDDVDAAARRPHRRARGGRALARRRTTCTGVDAVVLPGGFSYGDYLRCGAIARFAPVMTEVVAAAGRGHAGARHLQRLPDPVRVAPAARRADPQRPPQVRLPRPAAADREQPHRRGRRRTPRAPRSPSCSRTARAATSPTSATLDRLEGEGRVVARYLGVNPNGSLRDIAGITNEARQRRRPDAAPRARRRGPLRARHRRARLLHQPRRRPLRVAADRSGVTAGRLAGPATGGCDDHRR